MVYMNSLNDSVDFTDVPQVCQPVARKDSYASPSTNQVRRSYLGSLTVLTVGECGDLAITVVRKLSSRTTSLGLSFGVLNLH